MTFETNAFEIEITMAYVTLETKISTAYVTLKQIFYLYGKSTTLKKIQK